MTYFELINASFNYLFKEGSMKDEDLYDPRTSKYYYSKLRLYFNLHELAKKVEITKDIKNLLNYLEKSLNTYALDIYASIIKTNQNRYEIAMQKLKDNPHLQELLEQLESEEVPDEEVPVLKQYLDENFTELYYSTPVKFQKVIRIYKTAMDNVIRSIIFGLPTMLFSEIGSSYTNNEYYIKDEERRKMISYHFYRLLLSKKHQYLNNNTQLIYYSYVQLITLMYRLSDSNNKLYYLFDMEDYYEKYFPSLGNDTTLLAHLIQNDDVQELNFDSTIEDEKTNHLIDFFFNDSLATNNLTPEENVILLLASTYTVDKNILVESIIQNWNLIYEVIKSDNNFRKKRESIKTILKKRKQ